MSDTPADNAAVPARAATAGGLLRQARQAQGLHIAALAAAIKVTPRKLELLESDQIDQLPDATFTRALAHTVCRALKIDPVPVLALLPPPRGVRLEQVAEGLNMPFRERPGQLVPREWTNVAMPALLLAALLVIAAVAIYVIPAGWIQLPKAITARVIGDTTAPPPVVNEAVATPQATTPVPTPTATPAAPAVADSAPAAVSSMAQPPAATVDEARPPEAVSGVLQLRPSEESWVEVIDARGKPLISRLVQAGESVGLDGAMPFKVKIGNANATQVVFRGQPLELGPFTRDNMAKLELR